MIPSAINLFFHRENYFPGFRHGGPVIILALLLLVVIPCVCSAEPGGSAWNQVTAHGMFTGRYSFGVADFAGRMWVIGGSGPSGFLNDVWYSDDGSSWTEATDHAPFSPRGAMAVTVFQDKLWVIGGNAADESGLNDVWYTRDGTTWTEATRNAPFLPREGATLTVFDGKMWIIGGGTKSSPYQQFWGLANDVWYSSDGVTWTEATNNGPFPPRTEHATVAFNGSLWVLGGWNGQTVFDDIWTSQDGVQWTQVPATQHFAARCSHRSAVFDNRIWIIGGQHVEYSKGTEEITYANDVWNSGDGISWTEADKAGFPPRAAFGLLVSGENLWTVGGYDGFQYYNDVWNLAPAPGYGTGPESSTGFSNSSVTVIKTVDPVSIKQGTDATVTITISNTGVYPVHDIEILDPSLPEFPVVAGVTQYAIPGSLMPNETRFLQYTMNATVPGHYTFGRTQVMFAGADGNYRRIASNAPGVDVIAPLIPPQTHGAGQPADILTTLVNYLRDLFRS